MSSNLLVVVLDTNPVWWGNRIINRDSLLFTECIDALMVFVNSHLMLSHSNKLAIVAAHTDSSQFLYPPQSDSDTASPYVSNDPDNQTDSDGRYELFSQVDSCVKDSIKDLILSGNGSEVVSDSLIAGALGMGLCYINRMEKLQPLNEKLKSRVLIIKGSKDNPSQYMNLMNAVFTAQKLNITIDACILDNDSGLLQQACDLTGGYYLKTPQINGFLQYLLWVFLVDVSTRDKLSLPVPTQVDYRAACFCHRVLIDVGYVCSVCLSIFCTFSPICSTCQTTFKFLGPPRPSKKKAKKSSA